MTSPLYRRIYAVVQHIPAGKVATYGQIARLAEIGGHARQVGYAMHALSAASHVPWHRVVNAKGEVSIRFDPFAAEVQKQLLAAEGIVFEKNSKINLHRYGWQPEFDKIR
jgi:methylated-DNA-protein-cysteine methyltransferase-like protein